jgi:predicted DNA binding CopG/RHH family protein
MNTQKLPEMDSIEELAQFWDTHDLTDFEAELEEVTEVVFEKKSPSKLVVPLRPQELQALKRLAQTRGVPSEELVRAWVLEKLPA